MTIPHDVFTRPSSSKYEALSAEGFGLPCGLFVLIFYLAANIWKSEFHIKNLGFLLLFKNPKLWQKRDPRTGVGAVTQVIPPGGTFLVGTVHQHKERLFTDKLNWLSRARLLASSSNGGVGRSRAHLLSLTPKLQLHIKHLCLRTTWRLAEQISYNQRHQVKLHWNG